MPDVGTVLSIITMVGSVIGFIWLSASRIAKLEVKVDTIWDYLIKKAMTDALNSGMATQNSPIHITDEIKARVTAHIGYKLYNSLRKLYKEHQQLSDNALALKIQQQFGEQIAKEMCIPNEDLSYETCLFIALEIAKSNGKKS